MSACKLTVRSRDFVSNCAGLIPAATLLRTKKSEQHKAGLSLLQSQCCPCERTACADVCLVQYRAFSRYLPWCCRHLTCPIRGTYCALCQQNPNRRCEIGNNFAPKQLEKQPLTASCGSSIQISHKHLESVYKGNEVLACSASSQPAQEPEGLCLEVRCQYLPCVLKVYKVLKFMSCLKESVLVCTRRRFALMFFSSSQCMACISLAYMLLIAC